MKVTKKKPDKGAGRALAYVKRAASAVWARKATAPFALTAVLLGCAAALGGVWSAPVFAGMPDEPYRTGNTDSGKIAIQCNVAWGEENLETMLGILKDKNVRITFNILGEWADSRTEYLKMIANAGHELGNHGYYHKNHSELTAKQCKAEIERAAQSIFEVTGVHPVIFAPPSGDHDRESVLAAQELGCKVVLWSIDTIDWKREGKQAIINRVFRDPQAGDMILMHPLPYTVEALPEIIDGLRALGLEPCAVGDILP